MRARFLKRAAVLPAAALVLLAAAPHASADPPFFTEEPLMITLADPATSDALADHQQWR